MVMPKGISIMPVVIRLALTKIFPTFLAGSLMATTATTTLTLVENEGTFGEVDVTVNPAAVNAPSSDKTILTGSLSVELEIDTDNNTVSGLSVIGSNIQGTQLIFSANVLFGIVRYNATSSETIGVDVFTTTAPGAVDPSTGNYDASDHPFLINEGTLAGSILYAPNLSTTFTALATGAVDTGNPIQAGKSGKVRLTLPAEDQAFLQISATEP